MNEVLTPPVHAHRRPAIKVALHWIRRTHMYVGLFLLPWAILYGVTGFLFNHPHAFSDQVVMPFGSDVLKGTPLEKVPTAEEIAQQVVAGLQERAPADAKFELMEPRKAMFTRDFAFATIKADDKRFGLLFDMHNGGGVVRQTTEPVAREEKAPFAIGGGEGRKDKEKAVRSARGEKPAGDGLMVAISLQERLQASIPQILEKLGLPPGVATVTSVPDVSFWMQTEGRTWKVTYQPQTGFVSGKPAESALDSISVRRFLTRLHLAHGYPSSVNARWSWAILVDAMSFVMVFWGFSGLLMWWQIKASRKIGFAILTASTALATLLAMAMHAAITG